MKHSKPRPAEGRNPDTQQIGALCWRMHRGKVEVLLITSRDTGRWVIPKGWPIKGLTPGVAFQLAECCHPVPGDRIVGIRHPGKGIEVHAIDCLTLASGVDSDWLDLSWGERTTGAVARIRMVLHNRPGTMAEAAGIFASNRANIAALENSARDELFSTYDADLEVTDLAHLTRIVSALRASDAVAEAERL